VTLGIVTKQYVVPVQRYSQSSQRSCRKLHWNFVVFRPPNFWPNFISYSHHQTFGKIWWRSAQRSPRLSGEKIEDRNISIQQLNIMAISQLAGEWA